MIFPTNSLSFRKTVTGFFVLWFFTIPLFWRLDISNPSGGDYDILGMAPYCLLHLVVFYFTGFLALYCGRADQTSFLLPLLLFGLYFPFVQLTNYPLLTIRDVYLHSAPVSTIIETGGLGGSRDPSAATWPSTFFLHSILTMTSTLGLVAANYVLYFSLLFLLIMIVYSLGKKFHDEGYLFGFLAAMLLPCLFVNHLFDNFHHFSRTAFGFILLFLFFFSFIRLSERRGFFLQPFLAVSVIVTHPFQALALVAFVVAYSLLKIRNRPTVFALFSLCAFLGWNLLQNSAAVTGEIKFLGTFSLQEYLQPAIVTLGGQEMSPLWSVFLRDFYKYSLIFLVASAFFAMALLILRRASADKTVVWLSSILLSSLAMLFVLLMLPDWHLGRFTAFAALPASFSSLILGEALVRREKIFLSRMQGRLRLFKRLPSRSRWWTLILIFVVGLSASVIVLRFEVNYYYGQVQHSSELTALARLFTTAPSPSTIDFVSWRTNIYFYYFDYNSTHRILRLWYLDLHEIGGNLSRLESTVHDLISQSAFVVRGLRDEYTLGSGSEQVLKAVDSQMLMPFFNKYYSNSHCSLYERVLPEK